ncbi:MAG: biopolymer transporter ExbD [Pseudomonadota bacterium]|nr:biopolymer transporter ExbD [Pseudomonadota bacterium]
MAAKLSGPGGGGRFDLNQNSDINVTPFVDVMLVLLIVMMVSAPMATKSIKVDLPPSTPNQQNNDKHKPTFISIQKSGDIFLTGDSPSKTSLDRLAADLQTALHVPDARTETILVRADRDVPYEKFMNVVNELQGDGFYKVGLIVEDAPIGEV